MRYTSKADFLKMVHGVAESYRIRAFNTSMEGFMQSMIADSTVIDIPTKIEPEDKDKIIQSVRNVIENSSKIFGNDAVRDDQDKLYDVKIAKEIVNPKDLTETVQQTLSEHIYNEAEDRVKVLEAQFDAGKFHNQSIEDVNRTVFKFFDRTFDHRLDNHEKLKQSLRTILSIEGTDFVKSVKDDVAQMVDETEAKNAVIRDAVAAIAKQKAEIEEEVNGEAETVNVGDNEGPGSGDDASTDEPAKDGDTLSEPGESGGEEKPEESGELDTPEEPVENESVPDVEDTTESGESQESWNNRYEYSSEDFIQVYKTKERFAFDKSEEHLNFDKDAFSREAAEAILDEFRELDDGIDTDSIDDNDDDVLSTAEDNQEGENAGGEDAESTEYFDNDYNPIVINEEVFEHKEIAPVEYEDEDALSNEAFARKTLPLNLKSVAENDVHMDGKFVALMALRGAESQGYFDQVRYRATEVLNILSRESDLAFIDHIPKSDIEQRVDQTLQMTNDIQADVAKMVDNLGILGILDGDYSRTNDAISNAIKSAINPKVCKPLQKEEVNKVGISQEELKNNMYEYELKQIFDISLKASEVKNAIADGINVSYNTEKLGSLNELLNEKLYSLSKPGDREVVEKSIQALESIDTFLPLDELVNIQAFVFKDAPKRDRIKIEHLKEIDAYGYSYVSVVDSIKSDIRKKYSHLFEGKGVDYNFLIDDLVQDVVDEKDTTKLNSNIFERVVSKLIENKEVQNSTEGLIIRNVAKTITTAHVTADKLGLLRKETSDRFLEHLFK